MNELKEFKTVVRDARIRFSLAGFALFSASLIVATGALVFFVIHSIQLKTAPPTGVAGVEAESDRPPGITPPWGELISRDVEFDHPDEYLVSLSGMPTTPTWIFASTSEKDVRNLLLRCDLTAAQVEELLAPERVTHSGTNILIKPSESFVRSLSPVVRGKLYPELGRNPANFFMSFPAYVPNDPSRFDDYDDQINPGVLSLVRSLMFKRGNATFFSDFEVAMAHTSSLDERRELLKALSREPAVVARMRIRPTTDVDKLLGYWTQAPRVRFKDLRPLVESIKRLPGGSTVSLLYFLPPFARERLYTYPLPSKAGDPAMDCHWSSLNFFREEPDNRLGDPAYVSRVLASDYYQVQRPSKYGDIIVLSDSRGHGLHSAVYIADDIVFTKNGNNHLQPWMLMRLDKLIARYSMQETPRVITYRDRAS
jgi:hypothetical protein